MSRSARAARPTSQTPQSDRSPRPGADVDADAPPQATGFKGNKSYLPSKPCVVCGRTMTWRRAWARNWAEVRYCSDACRRAKAPRG